MEQPKPNSSQQHDAPSTLRQHEGAASSAAPTPTPDRRNASLLPTADDQTWQPPTSSRISDLLSTTGGDLQAPITPDGKTMLHWAAMHGKAEMLSILLAQGLDADAVTANGSTPLHLAAENGHAGIAELLIAHGANTMALNRDGRPPLYYAVHSQAHAVIYCLLSHGVDINAPIINGMTLLHRAASEGMWSIMEVLLNYGADINARTPEGYTPLWYAMRHGYTPMADLLRMRGADTDADPHGQPPTPEHSPKYSPLASGHRRVAERTAAWIGEDYSRAIAIALLVIWIFFFLRGCRM